MVEKGKILVSGSLAFDIIFSIQGSFQNSIPLNKGQIDAFNASYTAQEKKEYAGGTAGNIAFWLGTEKIPSSIFSVWGADLEHYYRPRLEKIGANLRGKKGQYTANAYIASDEQHQQLTIWQPNSYAQIDDLQLQDYFSNDELLNFEIAIFAAGTPLSITKQIVEFRKINPRALIILDPGQISPYFKQNEFKICLKNSDLLIGNEVEFSYFHKLANLDNIRQVETQGAKGVRVRYNGEINLKIPAMSVKKVVNSTGAGDAFRAGFIAEIAQGTDWTVAAQKGAELGAKCVALPSSQY